MVTGCAVRYMLCPIFHADQLELLQYLSLKVQSSGALAVRKFESTVQCCSGQVWISEVFFKIKQNNFLDTLILKLFF